MRIETGGALVLLGATLAALAWANSPWWHTYEAVWRTPLSIHVGRLVISEDLRHWVNSGLMTFYFLVVGLEAKRELDVGELRERRRGAISMVAALGGMVVPVAIYLAVNAGGQGATAGAPPCPPTPRLHWASWRSSRRPARGCACACSP
jgi:Na+/H+ antiporter NhaA